MRFQALSMLAILATCGSPALAYVPAKTATGADRHWSSGTISVQLTGPSAVDGHAVLDGARNAVASWNAIAHTRIHLTAAAPIGSSAPAIGNGVNEFGWVENSDDPYFIPGIPCTTAYIYDTLTGVMAEADTTCNAMSYQWPDNLLGLTTQNNVADAETMALSAFGTWLGLDASLLYGDPMQPVSGSGRVLRGLTSDEFAFAQHRYGDGTSVNGSIRGTVNFSIGSPVPYAYVLAFGIDSSNVYGAVTDTTGAYTIFEAAPGAYKVLARPLTTDPAIESSLPYRANPISNLNFSPEYYAGGATVLVQNATATANIDITPLRTGTEADGSEPNDSQAAASPLAVGSSRLASTHVPFDKDWYRFQTSANTCYLVMTTLHGASIIPAQTENAFWSRTRLSIYDGAVLVGQNESRDALQSDPGNWLTYCESGSGRRIDVEVEQRFPLGGAGFFYGVSVQTLAGGTTSTPSIGTLNPNAGWAYREESVWIGGLDFMPGASVEIRVPSGGWVAASQVAVTGCDASYRCNALKANFPAASAGAADLRVTNPNGRSITKTAAFTYRASGHGPMRDKTPQAFGVRFGDGKAVCIGDYDGDGSDDIFKSRNASLPYQLFRNNRNGTFADVAASTGLRTNPALYGLSCSFIDVDDDGDLDLFASNLTPSTPGGTSNEFYTNQLVETGAAGFVLNTPSVLVGDSTRYQADAAWADFDRDGRLDVVLVDDAYAKSPPYRDAVHLFLQNVSGGFDDVTQSSGLAGYVAAILTVKVADFDHDGCDDLLFFTNFGAANRLYLGNCRGQFTDGTAASHIADGTPLCAGVAVSDFNNDGKIDIFCGTYNTGLVPARPKLWINNGSASFTDRASAAGLYGVARNMDVVLALDEDNDGLVDVYVGASENGALDDRKDVLLRNTGGNPPVFQDVTAAAAMNPTSADGSVSCPPGSDERTCDRDATAGGVFDWFGDGAEDVFVTGNDPDGYQRGADFLWRNERNILPDSSIVPSNDWLEIALAGANTKQSRVLSNRRGIGARVRVVTRMLLPGDAVPTETQCLQDPLPAGITGVTREVIAGNQSQSSTELHFGLGNVLPSDRKIVDCVRVAWPSGFERAYTGLTANTKVVLAEDTPRIKVIAVIPNSGSNARSDPTTIKGLRFDRDVTAVPQVFFGAVPASSVTFVSEHELTVRPPLWQPLGTVDVTVVNTDGERDTLLSAYTYTGSSDVIHVKDPVPALISLSGTIFSDPAYVAARGVERSGVIADGITKLVFEAVVAGPGAVRFELDDDDNPSNTPPSLTKVGALTALSGGTATTGLTVTANVLQDGRSVGHAVYTAPQDFIRTSADEVLRSRSIRVRATFIDTAQAEHPMPLRSLELFRVPILFVHGMWGDRTTFAWPILNDARFIVHRADYSATSDVSFAQNAGMPQRTIAELRKQINDLGIAGTRFFVFGHSMGAVLFKLYMAGAAAPYARADNFFAGDVYALASVDAAYFGSYLAPYVKFVVSLGAPGAIIGEAMALAGLNVDHGCMDSLDPAGHDILDMPQATGTFHAFLGWGGGEMRDRGIQILDDAQILSLDGVLRVLRAEIDDLLLRCSSGDDFVVCTDSQSGGLAGATIDNFHYVDASSKAIHFNSVTRESAPGAAAERLLNTPTTSTAAWGHLLPMAPPMLAAVAPERSEEPARSSFDPTQAFDNIPLSLTKQGDGIVLTTAGMATRVWKSLAATLAAGVCLAAPGGSYTDAHELSAPASAYYMAGGDGLCAPDGALSIASVAPVTGPMLGGYDITILGSGFDATTKVKVGPFFAGGVHVLNAATLTCRMPPGRPGAATVIVVNGAGATASVSFTYTDPGPAPGSVRITAPADGAVVAAGSTLTIAATGAGGFTIDKATVLSPVFSATADQDPGPAFLASVVVPANVIGPIKIGILARDAIGNVQLSPTITIQSVMPGSVALSRLDAEAITLLHASPTGQLHVFGIYSDGVRREVTNQAGIVYEMDNQDPRKPNYPYNGTGVAVVDAAGVVTAKAKGKAICHVTFAGHGVDVVIDVAEIRETVTLQKPGSISWPYQGAGVTYDVVRGKLSGLRGTGGNFTDASVGLTCLKNDFATVTADDASSPAAGDGSFYLVRDSWTNNYEESPYWPTRSQSGQRTNKIAAAAGACP